MDIFFDFNNQDNLKSNVVLSDENINKYFALMDSIDSIDPSAENIIKAPERLIKTENLLTELHGEVSLCFKELEDIKNIVNKYKDMNEDEKKKAQNDIKTKIDNINKIFETDFFSGLKYSYIEMDFYSSSSKFIVQAGRNMDQSEWFYLGPGKSTQNYSIYGLGLDGVDLVNKTDESINTINEAYRVIYYELGKLKTYINRIKHIKEFNLVYEKPCGDYYEYKKNTVNTSPIELTKNFLLISDEYLSNTLMAVKRLREIADIASNSIMGVEDRLLLQVEVSSMIDEISRIGSHAHFNGMIMLTGRFGVEDISKWSWDPSFYVNLDKSVDNFEKIKIGGFTPYELDFIDKASWEPASVMTKEKAGVFLKAIDKAEEKINKQKEELDKTYIKLPTHQIYKNNPLKDYINDYDFDDYLNKGKTSNYSLNPDSSKYDNYLKIIKLYISKLDEVESNLIKIRNLSVKASSGIYISSEKSEFDTKAQMLINEIDSILQYTYFNNNNIFDYGTLGKDKFIFNNNIKKQFILEPLTVEKLKLRGGYRSISLTDWSSANMSIGTIDSSLSWIYKYRNTLHCHYETIKIYEKLNIFCKNLDAVYYLDKKDREEAVKYWTKNIIMLSDGILKEMQYYSWKSTNTIYTYSDRYHLQMHFDFLAENIFIIQGILEKKLNGGLITNSMIDKNFNSKILAGYKNISESLIGEKKKYIKINSRADAVKSFNIISSNISNLEKINNSIKTKKYDDIYDKYEKKWNEIDIKSYELKKNEDGYQKLKGIYFALDEIEKSAAIYGDRKNYISKLINETKIGKSFLLKGEEVVLNLPDKNKLNIKLKSIDGLKSKEKLYTAVMYNKEIVNSYMLIYKANYIFKSLMKKRGNADKIKLISSYISLLQYACDLFLKSNSLLYNDSQKDVINGIGYNILEHYNYFIGKDKNVKIQISIDKIKDKEAEEVKVLIETLKNEILRLD